MKKNKILAALLSLTVVLATLPAATSTAEAEDNSNSIAVQAATGWQPKATRTVTSSNFPLTINNNEIVQINGPVNYTAATGKSPITVASGAKAKIIINGSVTLTGANGSGTTGATAAIYVPSNASITIYSAHDETLSTSTAAPQDTLTLKGGNAAAGSNGSNAEIKETIYTGGSGADNFVTTWHSGAGGAGGGGAAAAIGGNGGNGGGGGVSKQSPVKITKNLAGTSKSGQDNNKGGAGADASNGSSGTVAGKIYISGRLTLNATGGSGAKGGDGGSGCKGLADTNGADDMIGGCGGGGGGGGGLAAPVIGAGGAGGSGGGSGGLLSSDHRGTVEGCGGGGGGGGWPNGGGGGGGGAECSDALDKNDNTSRGGAGGAGGAVGAAGSAGSSGHSTGTNGHGINKGRYDAEPGSGGAGGHGVSSTSTAGGGSGGTEKDHSYNAGNGGSGGTAVAKASWNTQGNLILSTASKLNLSSSLSYKYGDGQGYGTLTAMTPYIIYDLMDCNVTLSDVTYPGADGYAITKITSISYSSSTDRDKTSITNSSGTTSLATSKANFTYSNRKHCNSGSVVATGSDNANRITTTTNGAVVGSKNVSFKINKANISSVPISGNTSNAKSGKAITFSVDTYTFGTSKKLNSLCISDTATGMPTVSWSITKGSGNFSSKIGSKVTFTPTASGTVTLQMKLSGMNDFNDYSTTVTFDVGKADINATLSTNTPHPRKTVTVTLPSGLTGATQQWYSGGTAVSGATGTTYAVRNDDIGKKLSVKITPPSSSDYNTTEIAASNNVESHKYSTNGFCTVCDEYQPASLSGSTYSIANGGQMFWFASLVNGDSRHAQFTAQKQNAQGNVTANINLENREWSPIKGFTGILSGGGYTISNMKISICNEQQGLFASTTNAQISNFTLQGVINLPAENTYFDSKINSVGGVIGAMHGGTISDIISKVSISNANGGKYKHVGGIIGEINTSTVTTVTKCLFEGSINIKDHHDCFGGILGYSNQGARISYCANLGNITTVKETAQYDPYTGGILGYVNNSYATVKNCYNYGTVTNGCTKYAGAIIGYRNSAASDDSKFTDNYYLSGSASSGFGAGSTIKVASTAPVIKSKAAFTSGEVCYLVNGKTSEESNAIWRQNIDNTRTPYDSYPLLWTYKDSIVYAHSDSTYSNYAEDVSVNISWGDMSFKYLEGHWSPDTHNYDGAGWLPENSGSNRITVTNNSNVAVIAGFKFIPDSNSGLTNFTSTFSGNTPYRLEKKGTSGNKNITTTQLTLSSDKPTSTFTDKKLGTITITITAAGGNS